MTTSHNRWIVRKERDPYGSKETPWFAEPERHWETGLTAFRTHAEALAYADRMARTTEIELPRATTHFQLANQSSVYMLSNGGASITKHRYQSQVGIPRDDLKPLAIALLAHHYRNQP